MLSSSKKSKQTDSKKLRFSGSQRKEQHMPEEGPEPQGQEDESCDFGRNTNDNRKGCHSTENKISIYHNPQINITSQNIYTGCGGRPGGMGYPQPYAPYGNQNNYAADLNSHLYNMMGQHHPSMPMMPAFMNNLMQPPNFQHVKNFVAAQNQGGYNPFNP